MTFEEKLNDLNERQQEAVKEIDGPVMVVAGPGTGKTEILSWRIGYILKNTDTPPSSILCLTYTDAAASEMRHRLIALIGPEAYSIQVNTFHSFCNLVIQENPSVFQVTRELEPISDLDKFRLVRQLIDSFDEHHPLKKFKGLTYSSWERLLNLFSTMKKENWSPAFIHLQIDDYIGRMRTDKEYIYQNTRKGGWEKGQLKPKFKTEVLDRMETLKAAVNEYHHYNALLSAAGKYDYDDMLLWVYDAFGKYPDLLANYQERFLYFLVDEFQDTNGIQVAILQKLIDHDYWDRPNVFVVGDDDQAIYRFQGANVQNMIEFRKKYDPTVILLEENYRSSQRIIDASRHVMKSIPDSVVRKMFGEPKKLRAAGHYASHLQNVCIYNYPTSTYENAHIFHQLKQWHKDHQGASIAVLYTKHESGADLAYALKGAGIPFQTTRSSDALQQPVIRHAIEILRCFEMFSGPRNDDGLLYRVLHLRYLQPRSADLQKLMLAYTHADQKSKVTLFGWLGDKNKIKDAGLQDLAWIEEKFQLLEEGITNYHSLTLTSLIEWIIHRFGIMEWVLRQPEKFQHLYAIKSFYTFADAEAAGKRNFSGADFLDICDMMDEYNIRLPVQELAASPTGIHLSTLHGAKGLQYESVIIKNFIENEWEKKRAIHKEFTLPDNLIRNEDKQAQSDDHDPDDADRRRLMYVGMTRAKKDLFLTYAGKRDDGKLLTPSKYLTEIAGEDPCIVKSQVLTNEEILADYLVARMSGEQVVQLHLDEQEIRLRTENFILNVSALNLYIECPVRFYYEKILEIPAPQKSYLIFGSALHDALQKLFEKRFKQGDESAGKDYMLWAFENFMDRERHKFTPKEFADQLTYGKKVLIQYYDHYASSWSADTKYEPEYKIRDVHIEGVPVTGFIDRMDMCNGDLRVYDYKTGSTDKYYIKVARPSDQYPEGGPYWRQMVFYDLLLKKDPRISRNVTAGYIQALEPDRQGKFVEREIIIDEEARSIVSEQIRDTYQKIRNMEFNRYCGECEWCKMHDLAVPYPREVAVEEG